MEMSDLIQAKIEEAISGVLQENEAFLEAFITHVRYSRIDPDGEIYQAFAFVRNESANIFELIGMNMHTANILDDHLREWEDI